MGQMGEGDWGGWYGVYSRLEHDMRWRREKGVPVLAGNKGVLGEEEGETSLQSSGRAR